MEQFSKVIANSKSETYIKQQYFTFKKIVEYNENLDAIKVTITPLYSDEVIYQKNIIEADYIYNAHNEIIDALNEWIDDNVSEQERIFVAMKEM